MFEGIGAAVVGVDGGRFVVAGGGSLGPGGSMQRVVPFIILRLEHTGLMTGFQASSCVSVIFAAAAMATHVVLTATVVVLHVLVIQRLPDVGKSEQ